MRFKNADVWIATTMAASLLTMWWLFEAAAFFPFVVSPVLLTAGVFSLAVCNECVVQIRQNKHSLRSLLRAMQPRLMVWCALWLTYLIILETAMTFVVGGGNLVVSVSTAGCVVSQVAMTLLIAPHCQRFWVLVPLTLIANIVFCACFLALAAGIVYTLTSIKVLDGGYMGDEFLIVVLSPIFAGGMLVIASLVICLVLLLLKRSTRM